MRNAVEQNNFNPLQNVTDASLEHASQVDGEILET
jgi:hypothetical protein